jgi:hypothetical protein
MSWHTSCCHILVMLESLDVFSMDAHGHMVLFKARKMPWSFCHLILHRLTLAGGNRWSAMKEAWTAKKDGIRWIGWLIGWQGDGAVQRLESVLDLKSIKHSHGNSMIPIDVPGFYHKSLGVRKLSCAVPVVALCCTAAVDSAMLSTSFD